MIVNNPFFSTTWYLPSIWLENFHTPKTHLSEETFCSKKGSLAIDYRLYRLQKNTPTESKVSKHDMFSIKDFQNNTGKRIRIIASGPKSNGSPQSLDFYILE